MTEDTTALETEADDTRDRITATIDGLQDRLSPTAIVNRTVDQITTASSEMVASVKRNLSAQPVVMAVGAVAIGLAMLFHDRALGTSAGCHDGRDQQSLSSSMSELRDQYSMAPRLDRTLIDAVGSAIVGAVIAQILPVSSVERKLLGAVEGTSPL